MLGHRTEDTVNPKTQTRAWLTAGLEPRLPSVSVLELEHVSEHQKYIFDQPGLNMIYLKKKKYSYLQQTIDPSHKYLSQ